MNKKWKAVIITCMVLIVLEVAGSLFFLLPYYRLQRVFNSIDKGQWADAQTYYNNLSDSQKETADSYMDGYGAYLTEKYIKGEVTYLEVAASFDAINGMNSNSEVFDKYTPGINRNEYIKLIEKQFNAIIKKNTEDKYKAIDEIGEIQKRMPAEDREGILVEMLNKKLGKYISNELSYEDLFVFTDLVKGNSINRAYNYAGIIEGYAHNIRDYRQQYTEFETLISEDKYIDAIEMYRTLHIYDFDTEYYKMYEDAYASAYESGKLYYNDLLTSLINSGDKDNSIALMAKLEEVYGEDFNLDSAKDALMTDWQKACVARVEDWESDLKMQLNKSETGKTILDSEYDNLKPDSFVLHDINEDGYPELMLFNSARVDDDYIGTFVYGYNKETKQYEYKNYVNIISFGIKSNLLAFPICFGRTPGEEVCLYNYDGETLSAGRSAQKYGDKSYVDGAEATDLDYLAAQTEIMLNQDVNRIQNAGYVSFDKYKEYIIGYENEFEADDDASSAEEENKEEQND